jgi:hypothetical protein
MGIILFEKNYNDFVFTAVFGSIVVLILMKQSSFTKTLGNYETF